MHGSNFGDKSRGEEDLDQRLSAYYGPRLPECPLPQTSWQYLQSRLGSQQHPERTYSLPMKRWFARRSGKGQQTPEYIQETFERIAHEARVTYNPAMVRSHFNAGVGEPIVSVNWLGRQIIRIMLPSVGLEIVELEIVLAVGLARSILARRFSYRLTHFLFIALWLLGICMFLLGNMRNYLLVALPIVVFCALWSLWFLGRQKRKLALSADALAVRWLGRDRICRGLHMLAEHSRRPASRKWGEPSLTERIERVCGTQIILPEDQLTLVR